MTIGDYNRKRIPEYYRTMYLNAYTPDEIMIAQHKKMNRIFQERTQQQEETKVIIKSEVKVR